MFGRTARCTSHASLGSRVSFSCSITILFNAWVFINSDALSSRHIIVPSVIREVIIYTSRKVGITSSADFRLKDIFSTHYIYVKNNINVQSTRMFWECFEWVYLSVLL